MNDTALKILSVFIAVALWVYVYSSENREASVRVPVTLTGLREGTMATFSPEEVTVRVSGPQALVAKASAPDALSLTINLSDLPTGPSTIKLSRRDIKGSGVETVDIIPNRIEINIDPTVKKNLPIRPLILDEPSKGYKIVSVRASPTHAVAEGLRGAVAPLESLQTENISVANLKTGDNFTVALLDYDGLKSVTPDTATVTVEVAEDLISRTFDSVRVTCQQGTNAKFAESPEASVTVYGRRDRVEALSPDKLLAPTDCNIIKSPGMHKISPFALPLDNITITSIKPTHIEAEVLP